MRYTVIALVLLLGQQTASKATFEVVAIKRSASLDAGGTLGLLPGGRFRAINFDVRTLVAVAYRTRPPRTLDKSQIVGGPDWMGTTRYDINAKVGSQLASTIDVPGRAPDLMPKLVQSLLEERFKLKMHYEKRESPVYILVVASKDGRLGPQLRPTTAECQKDRTKCAVRGAAGHFSGGNVTPETLATMLSNPAGRLVFDRTGLKGTFMVDLDWAEDPGSDKPSIFSAVQEQLGLKLESARESVDVVVIDHVERPMED